MRSLLFPIRADIETGRDSSIADGVMVSRMAQFDVDAMLRRYEERAKAVRDRPLPPVAGEERQKFIDQAETDYTDFALVASASWEIDDRHLVLKIPLQGND